MASKHIAMAVVSSDPIGRMDLFVANEMNRFKREAGSHTLKGSSLQVPGGGSIL